MQVVVRPYRAEEVAERLLSGCIGAVARGRAEAGPRALGNRSILADPRTIRSKERINGLIKLRKAFQPLAPLCLDRDLDRFFTRPRAEVDLSFMLHAVPCTEEAHRLLPAVVHADGTARVQEVTPESNAFLHELLTAVRERCGMGVLINTSFNGKGEPLVDTAEHAYRAFKRLDLDFLVLGDLWIERRGLDKGGAA